MQAVKTNAMRILDHEKISYTPHEYGHEDGAIDGISVARKLGFDVASVYKTLVTRGPHDVYVFVIPVSCALDLKKAAKSVGAKSVQLVHVGEINPLTGYVRGGCSPVGMKRKYVTVFDSAVLALSTVIVSAGKIGVQVETKPEDLIRLVGAKCASITVEESCGN